MIVFGIHCNFYIVLLIPLKACRSYHCIKYARIRTSQNVRARKIGRAICPGLLHQILMAKNMIHRSNSNQSGNRIIWKWLFGTSFMLFREKFQNAFVMKSRIFKKDLHLKISPFYMIEIIIRTCVRKPRVPDSSVAASYVQR